MIKLTRDSIHLHSLVDENLAMEEVIIQYFGDQEYGERLKQQILDGQKLLEKNRKESQISIPELGEECPLCGEPIDNGKDHGSWCK